MEHSDIRVADINFVLDSVKEAKETQNLKEEAWYVSDDETEMEILEILTMLNTEEIYEDGVYEYYEGNYPVPLLSLNSQAHQELSDEANLLYVNNVVLENAVDGQYTYFEGSGHMNFTDLPLFSPVLASLLGVGEVDATECITTMNGVILDYFNCYLKDEGTVVIKECY